VQSLKTSLSPPQARPLPDVWMRRTADDQRAVTGDGRPAKAIGTHSFEVLRVLTRCDFRARYRAQALGVLWSLLNPIVMMGILSLIFTRVFHSNTPHFPIFVLIGLVTWQWISASVTAATQVFVAQADLVKRTVFPRMLLPTSAVLSYGLNFCIESSVLLLFIPKFPDAFRLTPALLVVPVLIGLLLVVLVGLSLMTSVLNVIYRDVAYLVNTGLLLLYWLTPVIYPMELIPQPYRRVLALNPLAGVLVALRNAVMRGEMPSALDWAMIVGPTALILALGWAIYRHYERMVLDYV
jgi:ABC-type polysaccharide/polyol phosphate export permease